MSFTPRKAMAYPRIKTWDMPFVLPREKFLLAQVSKFFIYLFDLAFQIPSLGK